jgi:hypothetical protein
VIAALPSRAGAGAGDPNFNEALTPAAAGANIAGSNSKHRIEPFGSGGPSKRTPRKSIVSFRKDTFSWMTF